MFYLKLYDLVYNYKLLLLSFKNVSLCYLRLVVRVALFIKYYINLNLFYNLIKLILQSSFILITI